MVITMKYFVLVENTGNSFGAYVPDLPGCAVVGETREEALRLIREAIALHLGGSERQYTVYVKKKLAGALKEADQGDVVSHETAKEQLSSK